MNIYSPVTLEKNGSHFQLDLACLNRVIRFLRRESSASSSGIFLKFSALLKDATFTSLQIDLFKSKFFKVKVLIGKAKQIIIDLPVKRVYEDSVTVGHVLGLLSKLYPGVRFHRVFVHQSLVNSYRAIQSSETIIDVKQRYAKGRHLNIQLRVIPFVAKNLPPALKRRIYEKESFSVSEGLNVLDKHDPSAAENRPLSLLEEIRQGIDTSRPLPRFLIVNVGGLRSKAWKVLLRAFHLHHILEGDKAEYRQLSYRWKAAVTARGQTVISHSTASCYSIHHLDDLRCWQHFSGRLIEGPVSRLDLLHISQIIYELS